MFRVAPLSRHALRVSRATQATRPNITPIRALSTTPFLHNKKDNPKNRQEKKEEKAQKAEAEKAKKDPILKATTKAPEGAAGEQEGRFARTDENVVIEYPDDANMPRSPIVQGRGGTHFKRTLAQFSLENKVSLITGGARGLGLVMAQALVASGSDIAIVDLNSTSCLLVVSDMLMRTQRRKPKTKPAS